ncbi:hypothetical protein CC662_24325 [Salmonella enterica subsp. enterica]|nr:hypothetical protein [Salmonella enterica subsp. enterica]MIY24024.1 hypothetical protein [Salmonella enterica subsp. enterica]
MGHKSISSTEVYTKVFSLDVAARHRVQFQSMWRHGTGYSFRCRGLMRWLCSKEGYSTPWLHVNREPLSPHLKSSQSD